MLAGLWSTCPVRRAIGPGLVHQGMASGWPDSNNPILWSNNGKTWCQFKNLVSRLYKRGLIHCLSIGRKLLNNHNQNTAFCFGFSYSRGDSGAHASFISASLLHKPIHCIIFHFNAHLIYFSSRIHNSLSRRRAYQRKKKHKQQRLSLATHHRSLLLLLYYHVVFLSVLSLLLGGESTSGCKNTSFVYWEKYFCIRNSCDFFPPLSSTNNHLASSGEKNTWKSIVEDT